VAGERLVVDTNIVVSGLLTSDSRSPTRLLLDLMLAGKRRFILSTDLLTEYRMVLLRPKIAAAHRLSAKEIDEILVRLAANAVIVEPPAAGAGMPRDLGADEHILALLESAKDSILVTGDLALLRRAGSRARRPSEVFTAL